MVNQANNIIDLILDNFGFQCLGFSKYDGRLFSIIQKKIIVYDMKFLTSYQEKRICRFKMSKNGLTRFDGKGQYILCSFMEKSKNIFSMILLLLKDLIINCHW